MDILQTLEQTEAFLRDFAPVLRTYHRNLVKAGFTEEQAFLLVRDFQKLILKINSKE